MAEIDGRDAVEIICNTESVEKDELLLSLCKAFLTRQLHKGDMYYICIKYQKSSELEDEANLYSHPEVRMLCDTQGDTVTRSLVCKTIAFLLPHDLEICRACSLLVFCQERSLEAYRTVCLLYRHPDQEQHPHNNPLRTNVRFHILQVVI
ncbi:hypothetical protein GOODEAATRI_024523 [Goodea atripinnis]|uniref:Zinc finger protein Rlf/292/654 TPR repeats domain-containing protein n=1 Tax=Goodea atripinnis TaxID=208336 RepID=A0ABV0P7H7_9TELE